jgi:hypothetical protein
VIRDLKVQSSSLWLGELLLVVLCDHHPFSVPQQRPSTCFAFLTVEDGSYHVRCLYLLRLWNTATLRGGDSLVASVRRMRILIHFNQRAATWPMAATRTRSDLLSHTDHLIYQDMLYEKQ